jgi:hypothetical protein
LEKVTTDFLPKNGGIANETEKQKFTKDLSIGRGRKTASTKVDDSFKDIGGTNRPFIDNDLRAYVQRNCEHLAPKHIGIPTASEISSSDAESIESYLGRTPSLGRCNSLWLANASITAAHCIGLVDTTFNSGRLRPLNISDSIEYSIKDANAGYPTFKKKTHPDAINDCKMWLTQLLSKGSIYSFFKNTLMRNYLVLLHRFQINEKENKEATIKIRQVWCTPMRIISLENMFFRKLLERVSNHNKRSISPVYTSGFRNSQISELLVRRLRNKIGSERGKALYSMDYSKYDRTIPDFAIDLFFSVCRNELSLNDNEFKLFNLLRYYIKYSQLYIITNYSLSDGVLAQVHF